MLIYQLLKLLDLRQREALFDCRGNCFDFGTNRNGKRHIVGVSRLWNYDFVTWIQTGKEGKQHGLRTARGDDDVISRQIDVVFFVIACQFFSIDFKALARTIFQHLTVNMTQNVQSLLRGWEVGLSDIQVVNVNSALFGSRRKRSQLPNGGCWHINGTLRYMWHSCSLFLKVLK